MQFGGTTAAQFVLYVCCSILLTLHIPDALASAPAVANAVATTVASTVATTVANLQFV